MALIVLERDGVINEHGGSPVSTPEEWRPSPGALEAIGRLTQSGHRVVVAMDEPALADGSLSVEALNSINTRMLERVSAQTGIVEAVFFRSLKGNAEGDEQSQKTDLLNQVCKRARTPASGVIAIGRNALDVACAEAIGARAVLIAHDEQGTAQLSGSSVRTGDVFKSLAAFADCYLGGEN